MMELVIMGLSYFLNTLGLLLSWLLCLSRSVLFPLFLKRSIFDVLFLRQKVLIYVWEVFLYSGWLKNWVLIELKRTLPRAILEPLHSADRGFPWLTQDPLHALVLLTEQVCIWSPIVDATLFIYSSRRHDKCGPGSIKSKLLHFFHDLGHTVGQIVGEDSVFIS